MPESESGALPLGDTPIKMNPEGFEPPAHGLEVRCSIQLSYESIAIYLLRAGEGNRTLATSLEGWGSTIELHPHGDIPLTIRDLPNRKRCVPFLLKRKTRFELATLALARRCSTTEPLPQVGGSEWIRTIEGGANGFTVRPL